MVSVICFIPNQQNLLSSMQSADQAKFLMNNNCVVKPECTCLFQPGSVSGRQKGNKLNRLRVVCCTLLTV